MVDTVVLTGVTGYVAKHIALKLLAAGYAVCGTLRDMTRADEVRAALAPHLDEGALSRLRFVQLDLLHDDGWVEAMEGASAIIHTASPFPGAQPSEETLLVRTAVEGTQRALAAAKAAGINRAIVTSASAAMIDIYKRGLMDETDWCRLDDPEILPFTKSKTLAERAAWDFALQNDMALTVLNPGLILGPPLDRHYGTSVGIVARVLRGTDWMLPFVGFTCVDVRDLAEAHLRALQRPETAKRRFPCVAGTISVPEMGVVLKKAYPSRKIATRVAPAFMVRLIAVFDPEMRSLVSRIGRLYQVSNLRARKELDMRFISPEGSLRATAEWLIANGEV